MDARHERLYERFREHHRLPEWDGPSTEKIVRRMGWLARRPMFNRATRQVLSSCAYDLAVALDRERGGLKRLVRYAYVVHMNIIEGLPPRPRKMRNKVAA